MFIFLRQGSNALDRSAATARSSPVILSAAKHLAAARDRPFASLRVTRGDCSNGQGLFFTSEPCLSRIIGPYGERKLIFSRASTSRGKQRGSRLQSLHFGWSAGNWPRFDDRPASGGGSSPRASSVKASRMVSSVCLRNVSVNSTSSRLAEPK